MTIDLGQLSVQTGAVLAERYVIKRLLGTGGMASVYLATDRVLEGERVALKIIHQYYMEDERQSKRFLREVQLTRKVTHPNVVRTFDAGKTDGHLYFTMEYAAGGTLKELIDQAPLPYQQVAQIIIKICSGLEAIHQAGIVHRDMKPGNVLIVDDGSLKIADFGLARPDLSDITEHDEAVGSAHYMSPEMWEGGSVTAAADIYALGVIAYELLAGSPPYEGSSMIDLARQHMEGEPQFVAERNSDVPAWFSRLVAAMLSRDPHSRPKSAAEVAVSLEEWLAGEPEAPPAVTAEPPHDGDAAPSVMHGLLNSFVQRFESAKSSTAQAKPFLWRKQLGRLAAGLAGGWCVFQLLSRAVGPFVLGHWSELAETGSPLELLLWSSVAVLCCALLSALPIALLALLRDSLRSTLSLWFQVSAVLFVLCLLMFNYHCFQIGYSQLREHKTIQIGKVQWVFESAAHNLMEVALLMPRGTWFEPCTSDECQLDAEAFDPPVNYEGGLFRSELQTADAFLARQYQLVLVEKRHPTLMAALPYYVMWLCFVGMLGLLCAKYFLKRSGLRSVLIAAAVVAGIAGLQALETVLEGTVAGSASWLAALEFVGMVGPFVQQFDWYPLLCGAVNWTLIVAVLLLLQVRRGRRRPVR